MSSVVILSSTWSGKPDNIAGEAAILLQILEVLISWQTARSVNGRGQWQVVAPQENQHCFEICLEAAAADGLLSEAVSLPSGGKSGSPEELVQEVEECACTVLHCFLVALKNGLEDNACPILLASVDCYLGKHYMAISAIGEEVLNVLLQV